MNIRNVSYSLISGLMLAGICASCVNTKYEDKTKAKAVKYLSGDGLLKAKKFARQQYNSDQYIGEVITYWDSLLTEAEAKQAYLEGQQLIRDSVNGIHHRKTEYNAPLDTIMTSDIIESPRKEYAKYVSAKEFVNARNNAPDDHTIKLGYNECVGSTHYWNLITIAGRQNEAYQKEMTDARKEIKNK